MFSIKFHITPPETDWIQCQNPEGIPDALVIEMQTSTAQTRKY